MKYKKTLFGILIVCVGLFFIIWINRDKNHDPDSIYWAKEEFENEWEDQDYYERDNSQQNAREIGQTNETVVPVEKVFVNGKIKITKKVGLTITSYGNDRLPTGYLF